MTDRYFDYQLSLPADQMTDPITTQQEWEKLHQLKLDRMQLCNLSKRVSDAFLSELPVLKICIISSANMELIIPIIKGIGIKYGWNYTIDCVSNTHPIVTITNFEKSFQSLDYDFIFIALDYSDFEFKLSFEQDRSIFSQVDELIVNIKDLQNKLKRNNSNCTIIAQSIPRKPILYFGNSERNSASSPHSQLITFNEELSKQLSKIDSLMFDIANLAELVGLNIWYDERLWQIGKLPFSTNLDVFYAEHMSRLISSEIGKSKKCLVLDLDNTLWGGIVGQDGVEGLELGVGTPQGEAFFEFQSYVKQLKERGVILCICSKNNEHDVLEAFDNLLMPLKKQDFALIVANWNNKPSNIREIAKKLNIGLDSVVFVDDSPIERELVRENLPQVCVPEMPDDPAFYARTLSNAGYFDTNNLTKEDRMRAESYLHRQKVLESLSDSVDIDATLSSIEMELLIKPFDNHGLKRIEQLINKTNQFNLTTKRYNGEEVRHFKDNPDYYTQQIYLKDKFCDYGMIGVLIAEIKGKELTVDSWLLSCRAIGRKIELASFSELIKHCVENGIPMINGHYIKTAKNEQVGLLYKELGFDCQLKSASKSQWNFQTENFEKQPLPFKSVISQ